MTKTKYFSPIASLLTAGFVLSACGNNTSESAVEPKAIQSVQQNSDESDTAIQSSEDTESEDLLESQLNVDPEPGVPVATDSEKTETQNPATETSSSTDEDATSPGTSNNDDSPDPARPLKEITDDLLPFLQAEGFPDADFGEAPSLRNASIVYTSSKGLTQVDIIATGSDVCGEDFKIEISPQDPDLLAKLKPRLGCAPQ